MPTRFVDLVLKTKLSARGLPMAYASPWGAAAQVMSAPKLGTTEPPTPKADFAALLSTFLRPLLAAKSASEMDSGPVNRRVPRGLTGSTFKVVAKGDGLTSLFCSLDEDKGFSSPRAM